MEEMSLEEMKGLSDLIAKEKKAKAKKDWRQFHKGDFILTECGFPAFVYENQVSKGYISIYAFGIADEHGSEYPDKAIRITKEEFFIACENRGYTGDYVKAKMKAFKVEANAKRYGKKYEIIVKEKN